MPHIIVDSRYQDLPFYEPSVGPWSENAPTTAPETAFTTIYDSGLGDPRSLLLQQAYLHDQPPLYTQPVGNLAPSNPQSEHYTQYVPAPALAPSGSPGTPVTPTKPQLEKPAKHRHRWHGKTIAAIFGFQLIGLWIALLLYRDLSTDSQ